MGLMGRVDMHTVLHPPYRNVIAHQRSANPFDRETTRPNLIPRRFGGEEPDADPSPQGQPSEIRKRQPKNHVQP
jgi:hypothetical protein